MRFRIMILGVCLRVRILKYSCGDAILCPKVMHVGFRPGGRKGDKKEKCMAVSWRLEREFV